MAANKVELSPRYVAFRTMQNLRLLLADVPPLPLKTCGRPATCKCKYWHFDDRRRD